MVAFSPLVPDRHLGRMTAEAPDESVREIHPPPDVASVGGQDVRSDHASPGGDPRKEDYVGAPTQPRENAPASKEPGAATFLMTPLAGAAATAGIPLMGSRVALGSMIGGPPRR